MKTNERRIVLLLLGGSFVVALALLGYGAITPASGHAAQTRTTGAYHEVPSEPQTTGERLQPTKQDHKVAIQAWTIMAAGGAAAVGLLLFFLRIALGHGPVAPPPQEDAAHN